MKKALNLLVLSLLLATGYGLQAQSETTTFHQMWNDLPDDPKRHTEVAYAVVACNSGSDFILLNIFNEVGTPKDISLTLNITDGEKSQTVAFANRNFSAAEMLTGDCNTEGPARLAIPEGMNPSSLSISVTYQ